MRVGYKVLFEMKRKSFLGTISFLLLEIFPATCCAAVVVWIDGMYRRIKESISVRGVDSK